MAKPTQHGQSVVSQRCHGRVSTGHPARPEVSRFWVVAAQPGRDSWSISHHVASFKQVLGSWQLGVDITMGEMVGWGTAGEWLEEASPTRPARGQNCPL